MINLNPLYKEDLPKSVAIFKGQDSIKFLKFMTPFANELLEDALVKDLEVDESFAYRVVDSVLGSKSQEDRVIDWVCSGFKQVLKILDEQNRGTRLLRDSLRQYLDLFKDSGMSTGTLKLAKAICEGRCDEAIREFDQKIKVETFESDVLVRSGSASYIHAEDYTPFFETEQSKYLYYSLDVPAKSVAYLLYTYLVSDLAFGVKKSDTASSVRIADVIEFQYAFPQTASRSEFKYEAVKDKLFNTSLIDVLFELEFYEEYIGDSEDIKCQIFDYEAPMWMFQIPQKFKINNFDIHLSRFRAKDHITLKPSSFKSKVADYKSAPVLSSRKSDAKLVTRAKHPRAIGFAWETERFCKLRDDYYSEDEAVSDFAGSELSRIFDFFGMNGFFIQSKFTLDCAYMGDMDTQTIFLLSDVTETIPFATYPKDYSMDASSITFNYNVQTEKYTSLENEFHPLSAIDFLQNLCILQEILSETDLKTYGKTINTSLVNCLTQDVRNAAVLYLWYADKEGLDTSFANRFNMMGALLSDLNNPSSLSDFALAYGDDYAELIYVVSSEIKDKTLRLPRPSQFELVEFDYFSRHILSLDRMMFIAPPNNYTPSAIRPLIVFELDASSYVAFGDVEFLQSNIKSEELPIAIYRIKG